MKCKIIFDHIHTDIIYSFIIQFIIYSIYTVCLLKKDKKIVIKRSRPCQDSNLESSAPQADALSIAPQGLCRQFIGFPQFYQWFPMTLSMRGYVKKNKGTDGVRTRDLRFTRPTPYHLATAPMVSSGNNQTEVAGGGRQVLEKKFGSGGIRTHASEETGALNQRLRPLGHATLVVIRHKYGRHFPSPPQAGDPTNYLSSVEVLIGRALERSNLSLWRNRLARSAVNRKVGGSSPPRDESFDEC